MFQWFFQPDAPCRNFTGGLKKEHPEENLRPRSAYVAPRLAFGVATEEFAVPRPRQTPRLPRRPDAAALILSFCTVGGHLSDVDALGADNAACRAAGLRTVASNCGLGEFLPCLNA